MNRASLLQIAVEATGLAADRIRQQSPGKLTAKGDRDYASEVDYAVEREVRTYLAESTPSISMLGEEEGASGPDGRLRWALDPVDGTVNFAHSIPLCGVSLALIEGSRPVLGVIELPFLGNRYTAVQGEGSLRDGEPIGASTTARLHDAVVTIGDYAVGQNADRKNEPRLAITALLAQSALRVRMLGSAAADFAWLADGRTDALVTLSNKPWDTAAGVIIAREAGVVVVDSDGTDHTVDSHATIAAPPDLLPEVLAVVQAVPQGVTV